MARRKKRSPGDILRIDLGEGKHAYGQVCGDRSIAFFDKLTANDLAALEIVKLPIAFRVVLYDRDLNGDRWHPVGAGDLSPELTSEPFKFKQDRISGRLAIYHSSYAATNYERPATLKECQGLERAAVWEANHVEDRLRDHFNGVENVWVKLMAIDPSKFPPDQK